ncbi:GNAT family N-acetyltransferase [Chloroflexota bacterium]
MDIALRSARHQDTPAIYDLVIEGKINPSGLDWERFVVAETAEGQVVGCGQIKPHQDGSMELASISVTKAWRRKGLARAIIERLMEGHVDPLYLMCRSSDGPLYEKFGFQELIEDQMPRYFRRVSKLAGIIEPLSRNGVSLLVMGWNLPE